MTLELLIHAIVRQTTILIAQLATSGGVRAPLAKIANQVFLDLVRELERQGVSRKICADMFGLGLRTYRRKVQRLSESCTERGRSLWEVVLEHVKEQGLVTRGDVLDRFSHDDEAQVRAVLHDLCESQLVFSSGNGWNTMYRAASDEELATLQQRRGPEGLEELLVALVYREGPLSAGEIAARAQLKIAEVETALDRLVASGRMERVECSGDALFQVQALVIPLGAPVGWEAAVFDHYKAVVATILGRLGQHKTSPDDHVGGSTYTIDIWDDHPLSGEVFGALGRIRASLSALRERVQDYNNARDVPDRHTRVVIYAGQYLVQEESDEVRNQASIEAE